MIKHIKHYVLGLLIVLSILEIVSRVFWSFDFVKSKIGYTNLYSKRVLFANTKSDIHKTIHLYDKKLGWDTKRNIENAPFANATISLDSMGLRSNNYISKKNKINVLTLGDSFTFGDEVNDLNSYPVHLNSLNSNINVFNLGVTGYGVDQMIWKLEKMMDKLNPNVVIFSPIAEDILRASNNYFVYFKPFYNRNNDGEWYTVNNHMMDVNELRTRYHFKSKLFMVSKLLKNLFKEVEYYEHVDSSINNDRYVFLLNKLLELSKQFNFKLVLTMIPYPQVLWDSKENNKHNEWKKVTNDFCDLNRLNFVDIDNCFITFFESKELKKDGHWLEDENKRIAQCINIGLMEIINSN